MDKCQTIMQARSVSRVPVLFDILKTRIDLTEALVFPEFVDCVMRVALETLSRSPFDGVYEGTLEKV